MNYSNAFQIASAQVITKLKILNYNWQTRIENRNNERWITEDVYT